MTIKLQKEFQVKFLFSWIYAVTLVDGEGAA